MSPLFPTSLIDQIIKGRCPEFAVLMGMHKSAAAELRVTVFLPGAESIEVVSSNGKRSLGMLPKLHAEGLFSGVVSGKKNVRYRLRVTAAGTTRLVDDPYGFPGSLDSAELHLFSQGRHEAGWLLLGAHPRTVAGVEGVHFVVWAPAARRVSVLLEQNQWDGRVHVLYPHVAHALWELFVPGLAAEVPYKLEIMTAQLETHLLCHDPFAREVDPAPACRSRVDAMPAKQWQDHFWQLLHSNQSAQAMPMVIHELTVTPALQLSGMHWPQLGSLLLPRIKALGFTHLLLVDATAQRVKGGQHQPALLAAVGALGNNSELQLFVEQAHALEMAVLWDFSLTDLLTAHGIDPATPVGLDWASIGGALTSVASACIGYWHTHMHIDGFRLRDMDQLLNVANGKTTPASVINPFAREWLGSLLLLLRERFPSLLLVADSEVVLPELTLSQRKGGLGFDFRSSEAGKTMLRSQQADVGKVVNALLQQWQYGNQDQQMVALALPDTISVTMQQVLLLALWTLPGRKLLKLECRLRTGPGWQAAQGHDVELDFAPKPCETTLALLQQLNQLYINSPCLYELDANHEGINVLQVATGASVFERVSRHADEAMLVLINCSEQPLALPQLRLRSKRLYVLACQAGDLRYPAELNTVGAGTKAGHCLPTITLPAHSAAIYRQMRQ